jgi:hypothetical protein
MATWSDRPRVLRNTPLDPRDSVELRKSLQNGDLLRRLEVRLFVRVSIHIEPWQNLMIFPTWADQT